MTLKDEIEKKLRAMLGSEGFEETYDEVSKRMDEILGKYHSTLTQIHNLNALSLIEMAQTTEITPEVVIDFMGRVLSMGFCIGYIAREEEEKEKGKDK